MKNLKKMLAVFLIVSLSTIAACSDDNDKNNNNGSQNEADASQTDQDTSQTDQDTSQTDQDTGQTEQPAEGSTLLKDLTPAQLSAFCTANNTKAANHYDPNTNSGKGECLYQAVDIGYENSESDEEALELCQEVLDDCLAYEDDVSDECMNPQNCSATVAEFEKCTDDYFAAELDLLNTLAGKTCSDYATDEGIDDFDTLLDTLVYPPSCEQLENKCPDLYDF